MEPRMMQSRQTILLVITLFWLGLPVCLALMNTNCQQIEGPLNRYVKYFSFCRPPKNIGLVVECKNVTALPEDIIHIPKQVQALCVSGRIKLLKEQVFQAFLELSYLRLSFAGTFVISPGAFLGLGALQHLLIVHGTPVSSCINVTMPPDTLLSIHSLQTLYLENICLRGQRGMMFPSRLVSLSVYVCYQVQLSELVKIFPSLRSVAQVTVTHCRKKINPHSVKYHHNSTAPPAIAPWSPNEGTSSKGQARSRLQSLKLSRLTLTLSDLQTLEIKEHGSLSLENTDLKDKNHTSSVCALASYFSLLSLTFSWNYYKSFDGEELHACVSLESLVLQGNKIENVDSLLLYKLPQLQLLDLSTNKLHWALCPAVYKEMNFTSRLKVLDFSRNNVTIVPSDAFYCTMYLEKLSLNRCGIQRIELLAFSELNKLQVLNLEGNSIHSLENYFFSKLSNLASLALSSNPIEALRKDCFQDLNMLRELRFGSQETDLDVEFSFRDLKELQITSKSRIRFWEESINVFSTLEKLILDCNQLVVDSCKSPLFPQMKALSLKRLHNVTFSCNSSLPFLHHFPLLENFNYAVPPRGSLWTGFNLSHLSNLRTLVVVNLHITLKGISQDDAQYLFQNLTKLEVMQLISSGLEYISAVLFRDMKNLHFLYLENELLLLLDSGFQDEMMQLRYLYLSAVTFGCYCSNAWFVSWAAGKEDLYVATVPSFLCQELTTVKKTKKFLPFVQQNCSLKTDFILFVTTSFLICFLMSFPLVHATCGPQLLFLIYLLRGWWHRLYGKLGKGKKFEYDAFVSYCSQDQEWVLQHLVPNLEQKGPPFLKLCLHSRDFEVGKAIVDNIMDNLYNSRKTICVISRHSLGSHWCSLEMSLATYRLFAGRADSLILVFLEHISRYRLSAYHRLAKLVKKNTYLNWPNHPAAQPAFWDRLRNSLSSPCGREEGRI